MFNPISISFAPNFQLDDNIVALKLLLGLENSDKVKSSINTFKETFRKYMGGGSVYTFSSGRAALYHALLSLELEKNDEVLIQAFTCVAVPDAALWAGCKPVFVDADTKTYNIDVDDLQKKITSKTRVIVIQHTFGIPAQIDKILHIAKVHNLIVIEDCAHSLGGKYKNKKLGTFGDLSIFSFGRDKVISSVFGGCVLANNKKFEKPLQELEKNLTPPSIKFVYQQLLYLIIYSISKPIYDLGFGVVFLWFAGKIGLLSKAVYKIEQEGGKPRFVSYSLSNKLAYLLNNQLGKLKRFTKHRENISKVYIDELGLPFEEGPLLRVPVEVDDKQELLNDAKHNNIHLGNWYRGPIDPPTVDPDLFNYLPCPNGERLAKSTINLPTHIGISQKDALKIASFIKSHI